MQRTLKFTVETDCEIAVNLHNIVIKNPPIEVRNLQEEITFLSTKLQAILCNYVPKIPNRIAHWLASYAKTTKICSIWTED